MIRTLCLMGNPILRKTAATVSPAEIKAEWFAQLIQDMKDSMAHYGGIGIAAPQIGESLQVCVIELEGLNRYGEEINLPFTVFVNPKLEYLTDDKQGFWEGCLSVPGLRGYVERPKRVRVSYLDHTTTPRVLEAEGFLATVIQHELDHLFGKLYVDRVTDTTKLTYQKEFEEFIQSSESID